MCTCRMAPREAGSRRVTSPQRDVLVLARALGDLVEADVADAFFLASGTAAARREILPHGRHIAGPAVLAR